MRRTSKLAVGFGVMFAAIGMVGASGSFAGEAGTERHGVGGAIYSSSQPMVDGADVCTRGEERRAVNTIERIGHGGSTYQVRAGQASDCQGQRKQVDVVQRIGHGGLIYSSSHTMSN